MWCSQLQRMVFQPPQVCTITYSKLKLFSLMVIWSHNNMETWKLWVYNRKYVMIIWKLLVMMMTTIIIDDDDKLFRPKSEGAKTNFEEKWPQIHVKAPISTDINFTNFDKFSLSLWLSKTIGEECHIHVLYSSF